MAVKGKLNGVSGNRSGMVLQVVDHTADSCYKRQQNNGPVAEMEDETKNIFALLCFYEINDWFFLHDVKKDLIEK